MFCITIGFTTSSFGQKLAFDEWILHRRRFCPSKMGRFRHGELIVWDNYQYLYIWRSDTIKKEFTWEHLSTKTGEIPPTNGGSQQTSCLVADLDKDGAADIVMTDRSVTPSVIMYKYKNRKIR